METETQETSIRPVPLHLIWDLRHRVMYPDLEVDAVKLADDDKGTHLGLYAADKLVSVVSLFEREGSLQFRKFATEVNDQGRGYGSSLLTYVMEYAAKGGWKCIWCNARVNAAQFYEKFGMSATGDTWQQYGIVFIKMEKQLG